MILFIFIYGSIFLNTFAIEANIHPKLIFRAFHFLQYLFHSIKFHTTPAYTGSEIDVSLRDSFSTGSPINTGSLNTLFAVSISHLCFTAPHTRIAPSGSIPSLPIFLSSAEMNENISSYLAVTI